MTVTVRDLRKRYGPVEAARGVSFEVEPREIFGLLGPNGAGKTTTVECIIGLREPDEGTIVVSGIDARRKPNEVKQKIGAALQSTALQDKITPREALRLFGSFYAQRADPDELLTRFSLSDKADALFETLSGGQRQRLALALAFVNRPEVLFLDEPTAGLDPQSRRELHGEIARMKRDGYTVLLTTHHIDEAEQLCDRVAIIDRGEIIALGTPRELMAQSKSTRAVSIVTARPIPREQIDALPGVHDVEHEGTQVTFRTTEPGPAVIELMTRLAAAGVELSELHVQTASLEDVFIELTGSSLRD
jgi:ABC-2 type transport system ATP-binding protein